MARRYTEAYWVVGSLQTGSIVPIRLCFMLRWYSGRIPPEVPETLFTLARLIFIDRSIRELPCLMLAAPFQLASVLSVFRRRTMISVWPAPQTGISFFLLLPRP